MINAVPLLTELRDQSILILGLGREGSATFSFLRTLFPQKLLGLADQTALGQLSASIQEALRTDAQVRLHLGSEYLTSLLQYNVIIKSPGIPPTLPAIQQAADAGKLIISQTALFFANCPAPIVGVTGTKGKSTTASLIRDILSAGARDTHLVGNIGQPSLALLPQTRAETIFVCELSSYQLEGLRQSPHIAVLLNIVPEHLDYHGSFARYVEAKQTITRYQSAQDYLVYNAANEIARQVAVETQAQGFPFSLTESLRPGCFVSVSDIVYSAAPGQDETILKVTEVPLLGTFNLQNVLAAVAVGKLLGVSASAIAEAVRRFQPLEHRLELVGTYHGVTFYNAAIATVPQATIAHLEALGPDVQTILLGGYDRHLDFAELAERLVASQVKTLILFPTTGQRIWEAVCRQWQSALALPLPQAFFVQDMAEAVRLAYRHTEAGKICLLSPASPSFGLFRDYQERGNLFKHYVQQLGR
ncbi:MAG: UDP-N-acetylmuramoyl-L-alanine--D-glutamate ligase [Deltaproteobacteria bacterium]|nr:UDP-N-acetylmuramoyl-L-alanine--D-glutamate ligase [Deltaproteobacteria bacterium]